MLEEVSFKRCLLAQLHLTLDDEIEPLHIQGARGALFKITLASHGYTLVAKGTVETFKPDLLHEGRMYRCIQQLQGDVIPVYLGNVDLQGRCYYLDVGVHIVHMMFLSWVGPTILQTKDMGRWTASTPLSSTSC